MDEQVAAAGVRPAAVFEERVSTMLADRPCAKCMFNLVGQSVIRERHYGMLAVRCPECGTIACLQEYPLLGRWANRWAALAAALWLLAATAMSFGMAGIMFGFTMGTMETTTQPLAGLIAKKYETHQISQGVAANQVSGWWNIDKAWWDAQDKAALLNEAGGPLGAVGWWGLMIWMIAFVLLFPLAAAWAVGAAHRRGWRLLVTYVPMLLIAAAFFSTSSLGGSMWLNANDLAAKMLWPWLLPVSAVMAVIPVLCGAFLGRSLARALVVLWLPPRLRIPFSFLWICDGKTPPKPEW